MLKLSDIMTRQVVTVTPQTTLRDAVELFTAKHISGAPVVSGSDLVGVVSASDVLGFAAATPDVPTGIPQQSAWDSSSAATLAEEVGDFSDQPYFAELWADDSIDVAKVGGVMPDILSLLSEVIGNRKPRVVIAVAAREDDNTEFHRQV